MLGKRRSVPEDRTPLRPQLSVTAALQSIKDWRFYRSLASGRVEENVNFEFSTDIWRYFREFSVGKHVVMVSVWLIQGNNAWSGRVVQAADDVVQIEVEAGQQRTRAWGPRSTFAEAFGAR